MQQPDNGRTSRTSAWVDRGPGKSLRLPALAGVGVDDVDGVFQAPFDQRMLGPSSDVLTFGHAVSRILVLHELRKAGALTDEEFRGLKGRLLGL